jgi:hypothetical protein
MSGGVGRDGEELLDPPMAGGAGRRDETLKLDMTASWKG